MALRQRLLLALLTAALAAPPCGALSYERVRLVHRSTPSAEEPPRFLFRGDVPDWTSDDSHIAPPSPLSDPPVFMNATLLGYFALRLAEQGLAMPPPPYFVVDVNLLANTSAQEHAAIDAEQRFFDANPNLGAFVHMPTLGTARAPPSAFPDHERDLLAANFSEWDRDALASRLAQIDRWISGPPPLPVAAAATVFVYVHCIGGQDRTGEVVGSYSMRFLNMSASAAFDDDWLVAERWPHQGNRNAMWWYCYALEASHQRHGLDCGGMLPTLAPGATEAPPETPCASITSKTECGLVGGKCLRVRFACVSACRRWPDAATCANDASVSGANRPRSHRRVTTGSPGDWASLSPGRVTGLSACDVSAPLATGDVARHFPNLQTLSVAHVDVASVAASGGFQLPASLTKVDVASASAIEAGLLRQLVAHGDEQRLPRLRVVACHHLASCTVPLLVTFASTLRSITLGRRYDAVDTDGAHVAAVEGALSLLVALESASVFALPTARCFLAGGHTRLRELWVGSVHAPEAGAPFARLVAACPRLFRAVERPHPLFQQWAEPDAGAAVPGWITRPRGPSVERFRVSFK